MPNSVYSNAKLRVRTKNARLARLTVILLLALQACAIPLEPKTKLDTNQTIPILDVSRLLTDRWRSLEIKGETNFQIVSMDGELAIRAQGAGGAAGLIRRISFSPNECPLLSWTWTTSRIQPSADLSKKATDDVAAAIFVLFGDPGFLTDPDPVPTLRYVWTSNAHKVGDLIPNPYMPATVRNIVVRAGSEKLSQWTVERRSLADDFQRAFGKPPEENVSAIALFADNDQTGEPFESYFKAISVDCGTSS